MVPHEFEYLWRLALYGPLTAGEIADDVNRGRPDYSRQRAQTVGIQLRRLASAGLVRKRDDAIYELTAAGREYVDR